MEKKWNNYKMLVFLTVSLALGINLIAWCYVDITFYLQEPFWNIPKIIGGLSNILFLIIIGYLIDKY